VQSCFCVNCRESIAAGHGPVAMSQNTCTFQNASDQVEDDIACSTQSSQKSEHLRRNTQNMASLSLVSELVIKLFVCEVRLPTCDVVAATKVVFS